MHTRKLRDLLLATAPQPHRPSHLAAASGLVRAGECLYVVADDELHLGVFPLREASPRTSPGTLIRLLPGDLPDSKADRKKAKPDFEALLFLDPFGRYAHGALLALGSGSKPNRRLGAMLALDAHGVALTPPHVFDAAGLYEAAAREVHDLNIEGAVVVHEELVLLHRGNRGNACNALFTFELASVLRSVESGGFDDVRVLAIQPYELGDVGGVPLCFTDGAVLPDGALLFSAVAEDTADSYHDGPCIGSAIGIIAANRRQQTLHYLDTPLKVEGVHAECSADRIDLWMVTDADDAGVAAQLHAAQVRLP